MKQFGRILAAGLALVMLLALAACGGGSDSTLTSAQAGLYIETAASGTQSVVTLYGSSADSYSVDKNGNIVDSNNKVYVKADNTLAFNRIRQLVTEGGDTATFELWYNIIVPATAERDATVEAQETKFTLPVTIEPFDATCQVLTATIDDPTVIQFDEENNNIPSYGSISIDEYGRQTIVVSSNGVGSTTIGLKASKVGTTNIRVATLDGSVSIWLAAKVELNAPKATAPKVVVNEDGSTTTTNNDGTTVTTATNNDGTTTTTTTNTDGSTTTTTQVVEGDTSRVVSDAEAGFTAFQNNQTKYITAVSGLNMRSGPGSAYAKIEGIGYGTAVIAMGTASNGWVKVSANGVVGYVSANYLSDTNPVDTTTTTEAQAPAGNGGEYIIYEPVQVPTSSEQSGATVIIN